MMEVRFLIHISIEDILQKRAVLAGNNKEERDEEMLTRLSVQDMCEKNPPAAGFLTASETVLKTCDNCIVFVLQAGGIAII